MLCSFVDVTWLFTHTRLHTHECRSVTVNTEEEQGAEERWMEGDRKCTFTPCDLISLIRALWACPPNPPRPRPPPQACRLTCVFVAMIFFHTLHQSLTVCLFFKLMTNKTFMKTKTFVPKIQRIRQTKTLFCSENLVLSLLVCMCCWLLNQQSSDHLNN